ncbi:MAG TPA: phosphate acyltransferase PlsX [Aggregatilineales bacterium]|nr:phosphate acyltransferase PlsX [Aggregatilineales bacterium]
MKIVLDAMGSDHCPEPDVAGAVQAARQWHDEMILVGDKVAVERELANHDLSGLSLDVVHADQAVDMHDSPSQVAHSKPQSSMMIGLNLVKDGKADAFVTAGNTGAVLALATLSTLRRIKGVKRPTLTALIPVKGRLFILTDLGANADARPDWLLQFGMMGSLYAERVIGVKTPRVALLSNGEEEGKGNQVVREASELFASSHLNYVGNVEPKEMLNGEVDVVVADGFVGNVALKTMEALGNTLFSLLREEFTANPIRMFGAYLLRSALRSVYHQVDPFEVGGAPLLGVNGVVIVGHGRTNAKGIKNAIGQARKAVEGNIIQAMREGMAKYAQEGEAE